MLKPETFLRRVIISWLCASLLSNIAAYFVTPYFWLSLPIVDNLLFGGVMLGILAILNYRQGIGFPVLLRIMLAFLCARLVFWFLWIAFSIFQLIFLEGAQIPLFNQQILFFFTLPKIHKVVFLIAYHVAVLWVSSGAISAAYFTLGRKLSKEMCWIKASIAEIFVVGLVGVYLLTYLVRNLISQLAEATGNYSELIINFIFAILFAGITLLYLKIKRLKPIVTEQA